MAIKKLLKEGVTYNSLRTIFEECCSFLDFYETMKSYGIERKVAKVMALHFSGKGFLNQGAKTYSKLHEAKTTADESTEDQSSGDHSVQQKNSECVQQVKLATEESRPESKSCDQDAGGGEDWEREAATAKRQNFTLKCTTSTPLSLMNEDFSSTSPGRTARKPSPKERRQKPSANTGSKVTHSPSEASECRKSDSIGKRPQSNVAEAEVRARPSAPKSRTESREKRREAFNKPVKSNKRDPRAKRETVDLSQESTKELMKGKKTKSKDRPKETPGEKKTKPVVSDISSNDYEAVAEIKQKSRGPSCDPSPSSDQGSTVKLDEESHPTVVSSLDNDSSEKRDGQNFTRIFVGDIAILVPVDDSEVCDSLTNELRDTNSDRQGELEETSVADNVRSGDASSVCSESLTVAVKPVQMETTILYESSSTSPPSPHRTLSARHEDAAHLDSIPQHTEVVDKEQDHSSKCEETLVLASGIDGSHSQMESEFKTVASSERNCSKGSSEEAGVCGDDKSDITDKTTANSNEAVFAIEETNNQNETNDSSLSVATVQVQALQVEIEANHPESVTGENGCKSGPYKELEQTPLASLSEDSLDQVSSGRFVMSEGFACQDMNTDEVDENRRDLQAELSSDTSSTSDESSVDTFSRQPPLGAERGFTPDTVQQYPHQTAWVESMNEGVHAMPYAAGVNYPQGSFPPYANPYGTFYQTQQALPLFKPYFPSFGYPNQIRPMVSPHVLQPQSQIFLPPYHQYRSQVMMPGAVQQVTGFPSAAVQPSQFRPQVYQVLQGPTGYTYPPVPFYGNPSQQAQESASVLFDAESTQPQHILTHSSPTPEFASPAMSEQKEESGSELSSSTSSGSPFEIITLPASDSFRPLCDYSTQREESFSGQLEPEFENSLLVANEGSNVAQVVNSGVSEMANDNDKYLDNTKDSGFLKQSKEYSSQPLRQDKMDSVHKQITILSRDESIVAMEKRLSPDGSCVDTGGVDFVSDTIFVHKMGNGLEEKTACQRTLQDQSQNNGDCRPSSESAKPKCPSPKPQRIKESLSRRNKPAMSQPVSGQKAGGGSSDIMSVSDPASVRQSLPPKTLDQHRSESAVTYCKKTKTTRSPKTVRFSNESTEHESTNGISRATTDDNTQSSCRGQRTESFRMDERDASRLLEGRSQRHTKERTLGTESTPVYAKRNSRKRINNRMRRPYGERNRPPKHPPSAVKAETDAKIDPNNNRG